MESYKSINLDPLNVNLSIFYSNFALTTNMTEFRKQKKCYEIVTCFYQREPRVARF